MTRSSALILAGHVLLLTGCGGPDQNAVPDGVDVSVGGSTSGSGASSGSGSAASGSGGLSAAGGGDASGGLTGGGGFGIGGSVGVGGSTIDPCDYPEWVDGATYYAGDVVYVTSTQTYYVAEYDNPGYEPWTSTWFWEPTTCSGGTGGSTSGTGGSTSGTGGAGAGGTTSSTGGTSGSGGSSSSGFGSIVSESLFNQIFPNRNGFYTYQGLLAAAAKYPAFVGTGSLDVRKREAAAFLANVARETGHLVYIEQIQKDWYCSARNDCPCEPGKQYYGRGPIQISWNYNYCSAGDVLGYDLRKNPELVAQNAEIAWATGLWFWMTQEGAGYYTPHAGIVDGHGFGQTIRSINGGQECNANWGSAGQQRVQFYQEICNLLGVSYGSGLTC